MQVNMPWWKISNISIRKYRWVRNVCLGKTFVQKMRKTMCSGYFNLCVAMWYYYLPQKVFRTNFKSLQKVGVKYSQFVVNKNSVYGQTSRVRLGYDVGPNGWSFVNGILRGLDAYLLVFELRKGVYSVFSCGDFGQTDRYRQDIKLGFEFLKK